LTPAEVGEWASAPPTNSPNERWPRALWGGVLEGSKPVRYVYIDEAGTSAREPVSVVIGAIVHPDTQWRAVESAVNALLDEHVPGEIRKGFIFHPTDVFSGSKYRDKWAVAGRMALLEGMVSLPRLYAVPLAFGMHRRTILSPEARAAFAERPGIKRHKLKPHDIDHLAAFRDCIISADHYLRLHTEPDEVATVVLEDVKHMRPVLRGVPALLRVRRLQIVKDDRPERGSFPLDVFDGEMAVTKIVDCAHYAAKDEAPLLQVADACAFAVRRWLARQNYGDELVRALFEYPLPLDDYKYESARAVWRLPFRPPGDT
jgi:hypothetical protein